MLKGQTNRRDFLRAVGAGTVALGSMDWLRPAVQRESGIPQIRIERYCRIGRYIFDPIGLYVEIGQTVRWFPVSDGFRLRPITLTMTIMNYAFLNRRSLSTQGSSGVVRISNGSSR